MKCASTFWLWAFTGLFTALHSQVPDTGLILPFDVFMKTVRESHPDVRRAFNHTRIGRAERLVARGGFDPKIYGGYDQKYFGGKNYYTFGEYGIKAPIWIGTEIKAAFETASGVHLNPESRLPLNGQAVFGMSQPLWQGLLFDERRAEWKKTYLGLELRTTEQLIEMNTLAFEAAEAYWKWAFTHAQVTIANEALRAAQERFLSIKAVFFLGDRMAMDTLESFIQVQDRQVLVNQALLEWQEATAKLGAFWWADTNSSIAAFRPDAAATEPQELRDVSIDQHPFLRYYRTKGAQLEIERKLKREKRKPKLNLQYNLLGNGEQFPGFLSENYKWGINLSSPLFFRSEMGALQLATVKIENNALDLQQKQRELEAKLQQAYARYENAQAQYNLAVQQVQTYRELLEMELARFELGESTFFLINNREAKAIESRLKLAKLEAERNIARASIRWANGLGFD